MSIAIPNKETSKALKESERDIGIKTFDTPDEAFAERDNL